MDLEAQSWSWPWWCYLLAVLSLLYAFDLAAALGSYHPAVPLVKSWYVVLPRSLANLLFAFRGNDIICKGYAKV